MDGALALGVADKILMLENSIYSILSPEGYASILWKDSSRAKEAAEKMKLTAKDLYELGVIDEIINEDNIDEVYKNLKNRILDYTSEMIRMTDEEIVNLRYNKFRNMGK